MLDIQYIKDNPEKVKKAIADKQLTGTVDIDKLLALYEDYLKILQKVESDRAVRNRLSEDIAKSTGSDRHTLVSQAAELKAGLKDNEVKLADLKRDLDEKLLWVPNVPADDVPYGVDDSGNVSIYKWGTIPTFDFTPKDHLDLAESLDIIDTKRGVKIGGFRSYFLKNAGAELERALLNYAVDFMKSKGFDFLTVPIMVNDEYFLGTAYFPWGQDDHYRTQDGQPLIGTAEVSLTSYYANEVLEEKDLPVKLVGISPCFRREIGSHGKDTKGVFRVHTFTKVEQVVLVPNDESISREWHEQMLGFVKEYLESLNIPHQVLLMCSGDMGAPHRKKYDVECWFPSQEKYRETHSDSYFLDFQARRLNIKYRASDGSLRYVHTLNNTVAATPRLLACVLENWQQKDGSIVVPEVLRPYTGFQRIENK